MSSKPLVFLGILILMIAVIAVAGYVMKGGNPTAPITIDELQATTTPEIETPTLPPVSAPTSVATSSMFFSVPLPASTTVETTSWKIFVDPQNRYSVEYPPSLVLGSDEKGNKTFTFPKNIYFRWPLLDDAKITVTIAETCPAIIAGGKAYTTGKISLDIGGVSYVRSIATDFAAGNRYTEVAFDTKKNGLCYHISFYDHGANGAGFYVDSASLIKNMTPSMLKIWTGYIAS